MSFLLRHECDSAMHDGQLAEGGGEHAGEHNEHAAPRTPASAKEIELKMPLR